MSDRMVIVVLGVQLLALSALFVWTDWRAQALLSEQIKRLARMTAERDALALAIQNIFHTHVRLTWDSDQHLRMNLNRMEIPTQVTSCEVSSEVH